MPDEKKPQFEIVRSLLNRPDVDSVTAATDAGREGELIFRFVYQLAGCTKPVKRLWISSMEDAAIREGFANLRPDSDYDALYQSALCRAKADWLVGINATRLFSVLYHKTLTVGRVQTPTLKMLVDRDAKILRFQKERYYTVGIQSGNMKADSGRIASMDEANNLKAACAGNDAICASIQREKKTEPPPKLYDLTTLQREANRLFGFTAKQTLDYAQQLLLRRLGQKIVNPQLPVVGAVPVHQGVIAHGGPDAAVLPGGQALAVQVDVLVFDAALLEPPLGLFRVKGLGGAEDLNIHSHFPILSNWRSSL